MTAHDNSSSSGGLEGSCRGPNRGWFRSQQAVAGVERLEAWFFGRAFERHRHATYAIGVTMSGVQSFDYRGAAQRSLPGQVVVLHPDEAHDGRDGGEAGFGYRQLYIEPAVIAEAAHVLCGRPAPLPFLHEAVSRNDRLAAAVSEAFEGSLEPLATDSLVLQVAEALIDGDVSYRRRRVSRRFDGIAVSRARAFLDSEISRVVRSAELETVTGLSRFELARQFRAVCGTSPYRYALLRRLDFARKRLGGHHALAEVALETGFADQAHFTRQFKAAYGLTPANYAALQGKAG